MILELINELLTTSWGHIAVFGTALSVFAVWLLYAIESSLIEGRLRQVTEHGFHPQLRGPYVKVKSFKTFETPFAIYKRTEPGYMWEAIKTLFELPGILWSMVAEIIGEFKTWSKTNYMFYVGVAGFAGLYYGGMLLLTNPMVQAMDKTIFVLVGLMLLAVGSEFVNQYKGKGEEDERRSSVEI